ncbi:flagellar basal-body MS-ring/collar protein FliF [Paracoccus sp. p4-l81]|uniref:flagellar basal-body MS-ring/collar protein FliF n=1 Tax=Paracoccus sp. p4-l81 TaxID=3342806 RepID=UPI0035B84747
MKLLSIWGGLGLRRQIIVVAATLLTFAAVLGLSGAFSAPRMALLYSGLDNAQSGDVLAALEQQNVSYQISGGAIMVPELQRDELRMSLAASGLPASGSAGYELLDGLSGFGTTSQMFDAAYWRAREGELARTITATPGVRSARVHLAIPEQKSFRNRVRPTASVMVTMADGGLAPSQAKAMKHLIAAAVPGMVAEDVAIVDGSGQLIGGSDDAPDTALDRSDSLRAGVERLLAARVGPGNAVVEVSLDLVTESESLTERRLDPEGRIAISSETEERSDQSENAGNSAVTVASNLPDGGGATGDRSSTNGTQTRERVNYEVSETTRQLQRGAGGTRRLTVAVLVNGVKTTAADGADSWQPRSADEVADLRELVASAVGFDEARGDVITIRSLPFEQIEAAGTEVIAENDAWPVDLNMAIQVLAFSLVALILGLFVLRPILTAAAVSRAKLDDSPAPASTDSTVLPPLAIGAAADFALPDTGFPSMAIGDFGGFGSSSDTDDPVARLKRLIGERREETVQVLKSWMTEREDSL